MTSDPRKNTTKSWKKNKEDPPKDFWHSLRELHNLPKTLKPSLKKKTLKGTLFKITKDI